MRVLRAARRMLPCLLSALALVPLSGCLVVCLQPVYEPSSAEFVETLVGTWKSVDDDATLTVERGAWNAYEMTFREKDETTRLTAHLTRIGSLLVLDVTSPSGVEKPTGTIQVHWAFKVDLQGDALAVRSLDYDWFTSHLADSATAGVSPVLDGEKNVVLTVPTPRLRAWIAAHATAPGLWEDPVAFKRR